jgi:GNAT superfamily N-acetyltransferase
MIATIRTAIVGDEELLAKLNSFVHDLHVVRRPDHFKPAQVSELAGWYRSLLERSTARMWIAENEGNPVGYVLAIVHHVPENPFCQARHWCEIDQIAVDPNYRRQGIARSLVLKAIAEARIEGIRDIEATCWSFNNETHEVFQGLGFVPKTVRFELESSPT